jgi:hypothetical protein
MRLLLRASVASGVSLALVVGSLVWCPCRTHVPVPAEHGCCHSAEGLSAQHVCHCGCNSSRPDVLSAEGSPMPAAPTPVGVTFDTSPALASALFLVSHPSLRPRPSPTLRI